jgi:hypothetical protein
MKLKSILLNITVIGAAIVFGLALCEFGARLILHPADYLSVEMVEDKALARTPSPATRAHGFDAWGFRNPKVPESSEIVAIGDSHTYGNTATMEDSWPYVLARLTGRSVYNMGLGGYGPNQYYYLLKTRALKLHPKTIICGFYMGDDFENAYLITYGLNYWSDLRALPPDKVSFDIWESTPAPDFQKQIRLWLSRHSVVYQIAFHASILGHFQGDLQIRNAHRLNPDGTALFVPEKHIEEAFIPGGILRNLDQNSEGVREGMRITFKLFGEMNEICKQNHINFIVAIIPAKEMVFAQYLQHNSKMPLSDVMDQALINAFLAREKTIAFFNESGISYVDTLPALQKSMDHELYARNSGDMHPGKNGYHVIGEAISDSLKNGVAQRRLSPTP